MLQVGNDVLIDDGHVCLRVERVDDGRAVCSVAVGGRVESHKGVNLPGVDLPIPSLTEKDRRDLAFALDLGVDFVALSFVRSPEDVRELRRLIDEAGSEARVIAKIEKAEAVHALGPIVDAADAVMVARGDLGVEIGPAAVPLLQKRMILLALERARPVITATQMLESMLHAPDPTRAEASDVANAVLDGTSALMLSEETAIGEYPVEAVATMDVIARTVEPSQGHRHELPAAATSRRSARRSRTLPATSPRRCTRSRSSFPPSPAAPRRRWRGCDRGVPSSRSPTTSAWRGGSRSSGASYRSSSGSATTSSSSGASRSKRRATRGSSSPVTGS